MGMKADGVMGCAIYWKSSTVQAVKDPGMVMYSDANQNYIIGHFFHSATAKPFLLVTTHLKAKLDFLEARKAQSKQLVADIAQEKREEEEFTIVTGDFNEDPDNEPISLTMKSQYTSAFEKAIGQEPPFTTYYHREKEGYKRRTIDYVFYKGNGLHVSEYLAMP